MFGQGNYATVWAVEDKGNYSLVELSTSAKNRDGKYETDFSHKFVRFIGKAHEAASSLSRKDRIKIGGCGVSNYYDKKKEREYMNFKVFDFEAVETNGGGKKPQEKEAPVSDAENDDDLPF